MTAGTSRTICGKCKHPMHWKECGAGLDQTAPCRCRNDVSYIGEGTMTDPATRPALPRIVVCPHCGEQLSVAAPAAEPVPLTLDAAWKEAEAALPLAGWLSPLDGRWVIPTGAWAIDIRRAESGDGYFEPVEEGYRATVKVESSAEPLAMRGDLGPTPADALHSLAAALARPEPSAPHTGCEACDWGTFGHSRPEPSAQEDRK